MIQDTSIQAYHEIRSEKKLGRWQKDVLRVIARSPFGLTIKEVGEVLKKPSNEISGRVKELKDSGLIQCIDKRKCSITGRTAMVWKFLTTENQMELF